ncbi:helix-turn-helix transcriptional regulator [Actinomycetospora endophytica]|uniref:helix-turn-helix transcriptional regulator n=1 Tax=Actinomycetospora endophytica TaxID=2291215 RepID=UPI0027E2C996|nr:LuxR C-terminal-related transcriptional regulator [Actinomycetospora endophytica]
MGRAGDITEAGGLLTGTRLLTLTGAGGCGKTRLGGQVAAGTASRFPAGVWWVELAALTEGALVGDALARVLEIPLEGRPAAEVIVEHVAEGEMLVVLDNCEHLVDSTAALVDELLRGTGALRVLATSRQPLGVDGETTWRVPSMAAPPEGCDPDGLAEFDASRLFVERLGRARPGPSGDTDETASVVQVCHRLDGIPLALELAAARARTMSLARIVTELDDRFGLLIGGPRGALARHRTLHASVQWSYDLLADAERIVLRRLATFVGGFRMEAAQQVAGFAPLSSDAVLDLLGGLVDRSLVQFDAARDRYRLLETIRDYGREQLAAAGEADDVAERHLSWVCAFAESHDEGMTRADLDVLDAVEEELPNLRVALDHAARGPVATAPGEQTGLRLVVALTFFWAQRGLGLEGADRAVRVLAAHPAAPGALRGRAWAAVAYDRFYGADFAAVTTDADHGLAEATAAGDLRGQARSLHAHGALAFMLDPPHCRTVMARAIELARSCGDHWCETDALQILGFSHLIQHRTLLALDPVMDSAAMAEAQDNAFQLACHQLGLACIAAAAGRLGEAATAARRGADEAQRIGDPAIELWGRAGQVTTALARRRYTDLDSIAGQTTPPHTPLSPVVTAFVAGIRRIARHERDPIGALDALEELSELLRGTFVPNEGLRLAVIGVAGALALGDQQRAAAAAEAAFEASTTFGSALVGPCRVLLARLERGRGEPLTADRLAHDGLAEIHDAGLIIDLPDALEALGGTALDLGAAPAAARLLGAADGLRESLDLPGPYPTEAVTDRPEVHDRLGEEFAARWEEGRRMDADAAVAYARRSRGERRRPASGWGALTPTELDVARLAARGLTNPDIGRELFISRGTVKTHLEHIYAKLELHNRAELATTVARRPDIQIE